MKVRIIVGAYGYKPQGSASTKAVLKGGVVEVDEKEAERLISLGVAEEVKEPGEAVPETVTPETVTPAKAKTTRKADKPKLKAGAPV